VVLGGAPLEVPSALDGPLLEGVAKGGKLLTLVVTPVLEGVAPGGTEGMEELDGPMLGVSLVPREDDGKGIVVMGPEGNTLGV
jgi:hypothetical protein